MMTIIAFVRPASQLNSVFDVSYILCISSPLSDLGIKLNTCP